MQRISFTRVCAHWRGSAVAPREEYLLMLHVPGRKNMGPFEDLVVIETDGYNFWIDLPRHELGAPGEEVRVVYLGSVQNNDARGTTRDQWERFIKNKKGISYSSMAIWKLV
jgi:hypothetical protein